MRTLICASLLVIAIGMMSGCASSTATKSAGPDAAHTEPVAGTQTCVMQTGGVNDLRLTIPANAKYVAKDGSLHINNFPPQFEVEVWRVRDAKTVDEAIPHVADLIVSEFKDFKPDHTSDLTLAGSAAKRLFGSGNEADDGDPGKADVVVFKVGDHIFVACTHGENLSPIAQEGMITFLRTAQTP
jgi:hypothetical protein